MPLLVTVSTDGTPTFWTWNGTKAAAYNLKGDSETKLLTGYTLATSNGSTILCVDDGSLQSPGDAAGFTHYRIQNAQLTAIGHKMLYTAVKEGSSVVGQLLPLVKGATSYQDGGLTFYKTTATAILQAGWNEDPSTKGLYCLGKTGDQYIYFQTYSKAMTWYSSTHSQVALSNQLLDVDTGELLGNWGTASSLRSILTNYAQKAAAQSGTFSDVPSSHYAYAAVTWAIDKGITNGTGAGKFSPNSTCTNGQILTFLYRANGSPLASGSSFSDVSASDYFYAPAYWAKSHSLVSGSKLNPSAPCTRAQVVTYLWKLAGSPAVSGGTSFSDVAANADYAQAVRWAVQNGVTDGTGDGKFSPNSTCTRAQIVTFLYRVYH
jgi:hypothetical protein